MHCDYCDTEYARHAGENFSIDEILNKISKYDCKLVEITGGEPLLQKELLKLVNVLIDNNYKILIETNGSQNISKLPKDVIKIVDWKVPGSKEENSFYIDNLKYLTKSDEIKFVITNSNDYQWSKEKISKYNLSEKYKVLMSVVKNNLNPAKLCQWIINDSLKVRFQLQLHKYIWPEDEKGR